MKKRILSLVLTLCMLVGLLPVPVLAAESGVHCVHVHDGECGYVEPVPEMPCGHVHDETCGYLEAVPGAPCGHVHDEACSYVEPVPETPCGHVHDEACGYVEPTPGVPCVHVHDEACGYTAPGEGTPCAHVHDESCGFAEAVPEAPCTLDCGDEDGDGATDHAAGCGWAPAVPEQPCGHVHDEACGYAEPTPGTPCEHIHDEACGYTAPSEGTPCAHGHDETCGYAPAVEETPCVHTHDGACGYTAPSEGTPCAHTHDGTCGWAPAVEGHPCDHVCTVESGCLDPEPAAAEPEVDESLQIEVVEADETLQDAGYSVVLTLPGEWDSYDWQVWTGEEEGWTALGAEDPVLPVFKDMFVSFAFRCVVEKDGETVASAPYAYNEDALIAPLGTGVNLLWGEADFLEHWKDSSYIAVASARYSDHCFDVYGRENGNDYKTTFMNGGYTIASEVDGTKLRWIVAPSNKEAHDVSMGGSLTGQFSYDIVYGGRYVKITYQVTNNGSTEKTFKVGSSGDVMIDQNDKAKVVGTSMGLQMDDEATDKPNKLFNLVVPTATTKWFGFYGVAYNEMFTAMRETALNTPYRGDSGMAWSWTGTVKPGQTWKRYALIGVGELPKPLPDPQISLQLDSGKDYVIPGDTLTVSGSATPGSTAHIDVGGQEYEVSVAANGSFTKEVTVPADVTGDVLEVQAWAVNDATGAISSTVSKSVNVRTPPTLVLTTSETSVIADESLNEAWYKGFIKSSHGAVTYTTIVADSPGVKTVTYTASLSPFDPVTKTLTVHILPKPVELSKTITAKSGKSFNLTATMVRTGGLTYTETGFVYGSFQNPSLGFCDGQVTSSPTANADNAALSATVSGLVDNTLYYARAYAKDSSGTVFYGPQSEPFGLGLPNYGTFHIRNNDDNTFTIYREGGADGEQKVYYRTVNGSAVGCLATDEKYHFRHTDGVLTFADGEDSKTVPVTEFSNNAIYDGKVATQYANADRTYQMEIHRVEGGAKIGTRAATRNMGHDGNYTVNRNIYTTEKSQSKSTNDNNKWVVDHGNSNNGDVYWKTDRNYNSETSKNNFNRTASIAGRYSEREAEYINDTANEYLYRYELCAHEEEDGWEHAWMGTNAPKNAGRETKCSGSYAAVDAPISLDDGNAGNAIWTAVFEIAEKSTVTKKFPTLQDGVREDSGSYADKVTDFRNDGSVITVGGTTYAKIPLSSTVYNYYSATGRNTNRWWVESITDYTRIYDVQEPHVIDVAFMARSTGTCTYRPGDPITISLVFDEIVDQQNSSLSTDSSTITTNWGAFKYAGGAGTNVLYFTGVTPASPPTGGSNLKVVTLDCASQIKDMCPDNGSQSSISGYNYTTAPVAAAPEPNVRVDAITNTNGTLTATIYATNAATLQYAWTQSGDTPTSGWRRMDNTSGGPVTTRQGAGNWYLHARAVNVDGRAATGKSGPVNIPASGSGSLVVPELTVSANNSAWAKERTITVTKKPSGAKVTCTAQPTGATVSASGSNYTVDRNGSYTFKLTSGSETATAMVTVSKLDRNPPTVTIDGLTNSRTYVEPVTLTVRAADSESGLSGEPTGTWKSGSTTKPATFTGSNGVYTTTSPNEGGTWTLSVTVKDKVGWTATANSSAYTLNLNAPTVTVTRGSTNLNGSVNYTYKVNANGQEIQTVQLTDGTGLWPNGRDGNTAASGAFTLTAPGDYYVVVTDKAGHLVRSEKMTVTSSGTNPVDGEPPEVRLRESTTDWVNASTGVTVTVNAYDNIAPTSATWKLESGSANKINNLTQDAAAKMGDQAKTGSFQVTANGTYTVTVKDARNNTGTAEIKITNIDSTAPEVTATVDNDNWSSTGHNVTLTATDAASGVKTVQYAVVNSATATSASLTTLPGSSGTVTVITNGSKYLYYEVTDNAGNVTKGHSTVIKVDSTTPTIEVTGGDTAAARLNLTVNAANAGGSGVTTTVSKDGGAPQTVTGRTYNVTTAGKYDFTATTGAGKKASKTVYIHSITFDANGGSTDGPKLVVKNGAFGALPTATRTGYSLNGWYTAASGGGKILTTTKVTGDTTVYARWTLNAPTVELTADKTSATYTGSPVVTLTAKPSHDATGVSSYSYQWYKGSTKLDGQTANTLSLTDVADSGSYTVNVTARDKNALTSSVRSAVKTVTISKAQPELSAISAEEITYGEALSVSTPKGTAKHPTTKAIVSGTWSWSTGEGSKYPTVVNDSGVTPYSVTFTPTDTKNYSPATATVKLTVNKAKLTPGVATVENKVYDGNASAKGTLALSGAKFGQTPEAKGTFAFNSPNVKEANAVNVSKITLTDPWNANYELSVDRLENVSTNTETLKAEITPKTVTLTWNGTAGLVYNGSSVNVTAAAGDLVEGDSCDVTVEGGQKTDAGTHTARATTLSNTNYKLPTDKTEEYVIAKRPVTFTVTNNNVDYHHGTYPKADVAADGLTKDTDFTVSYRQTAGTVEPHFSGEYDVMVKLTNDNYKFEDQADSIREMKVGDFTIRHVSYEGVITWPTASNSITYGQPLSAVKFTGGAGSESGGPGKFFWKNGDSTFPDVATTKAVVVFDPEDTEYDNVEHEIDITVTKATLTPSVDTVEGKVYDGGTGTTGTIKFTGAKFSQNPTATGIFHFVDKNAGENKAVNVTKIALEKPWYDNYELDTASLSGAASDGDITPKPVTLTWDAQTSDGDKNLVYNGQPVTVTAAAGALVGDDTCAVTVAPDICAAEAKDESGVAGAGIHTAATSAGKHTAKATGLDNPNYKLPDNPTHGYTIDPKPIVLHWHNMIQVYNGSDRTPRAVVKEEDAQGAPAVTLVGVESQDLGLGNLAISVTKERAPAGEARAAGTYTVTGQMDGGNYTVKGSATLTIQKAPVSFTITNNSMKEGEARHGATVTPDLPGASFTAVYKNQKGETVDPAAEDLKAGTYAIWVTLTGENYRHVGRTDGKAAQLGVFTVYAQTPPPKYAVKFEAEDPKDEPDTDGHLTIGVLTGGTDALDAAEAGTLRTLPACGFACSGYAFTGWKLGNKVYPAGASYTQEAREVTFTAQWVKTVHTVKGMVDQDGKPISDVQVTLMLGSNKVAEQYTRLDGKFFFPNVAPGLYNLVATKEGVTMTVEVRIVDRDEEQKITLPTHKTNSIVEVVPGTPDIVVGNLEKNFTPEDKALAEEAVSTEVKYKFTVQQVPEDEENPYQQEIQKAAGGATPALYLELTLERTETVGDKDPEEKKMSESIVLLKSVIPLPAELQNKHSYSVVRCHGEGETAKAEALTTSKNADGEYIEVSEDKTVLTVYAMRFSTYAVAYTNPPAGGPSSGGPSSGGSSDDDSETTPGKPIIEQPEHGKIEATPSRPEKGDQVKITVTPDDGYEVDQVIVTDENGKSIEVTKNPDGTYTYTQPKGRVTISAILVRAGGYEACPRDETCPIWPYTDASTTAWYHDGVHYCIDNGLMTGYGSGLFGPDKNLSRAMLAQVLYNHAGKPPVSGESSFEDVEEGTWYAGAVTWAAAQGVVSGYGDGKFGPDDPITREQLAAMLWRDAGSPAATNKELHFTDADQASDWALEALRWAVEQGLLTGKGSGILDPAGTAARAEAAAMLQRFFTRTRK